MTELRDLVGQLKADAWRKDVGFSPEMEETNRLLFDRSQDAGLTLSLWLQKHQPCLFGRVAAKLGLIRYCIIREEDLAHDEAIRDLIQSARHEWTNQAFEGKASAFVILLISRSLAEATPDKTVATIAHRLCSLYLRESEVRADAILHERIWLEKPGPARVTWEWLAGVNYFSAQGDKRWWQDHRIPGGMAFSVNSVGHLARSAKISQIMEHLNEEFSLARGEFGHGTVRSLEDALVFAMKTIDNASDAVSGKATELLPSPSSEESATLPTCPFKLPTSLAAKNHCTYAGWYHTDYTLPSEYFTADVTRPSQVTQHDLDFTYLFWDNVNNPAFEVMGEGRRIRAEIAEESDDLPEKVDRMTPREVDIDNCQRLKESLKRFSN